METTIRDYTSVKKLYKVKGNLVSKTFWSKSITPFEGYVMIFNDNYDCKTIEEKKKNPFISIVVENNGNVHINPNYELSSVEITNDDNDYNQFLTTLYAKNLDVAKYEYEEKIGLGYDARLVHNIKWVVKFKDPSKVKFLVRDKIVDRTYIENMEIENGMSIVDFYDNGYSYMSSDPITKEKFLEIADEIASKPFAWSHRNIQITEKDNNFYIYCRISKNERFSEISNS